jgi:anti-sigma regulatory factor (Ser/Thr protein kinase)
MGDVVGHGIGAAALMGQLRNALRSYALDGNSPAQVVEKLDRLVQNLEAGRMATLVYMVIAPDLGSVEFSSAGHLPPLVLGPDGKAVYLEGGRTLPLGVMPSAEYPQADCELEPGSTIVLYTDGLVEERGVSIDQGLEALRLAAAQDACHPDELCDRLVDSMLAIHPANDDIAVLALRALPLAPPPLHIDLPSDPTLLAGMRRDLGRWLRDAGAGNEVVEIVQIACHEACSNAIEHGYRFGEGRLSVDAELDGEQILLTVRDSGAWIEQPGAPPDYRGNGLPLMEALMDSVELTHANGSGTEVRMARSLAAMRDTAPA